MSRPPATTGAGPRPRRLAIVIGDPALRSRLAAALVLAGVEVMIIAALENMREGTPAVTDRTPAGHGTGHDPAPRPGPLSVVVLTRDRASGARTWAWTPIVGTDVDAIVRAANELSGGGQGLLG